MALSTSISLGITTYSTVLWYIKRGTTSGYDYPWEIKNIRVIVKDDQVNIERKQTKNNEAADTRRGVSRSRRVGASVVANEKDSLDHVRPYYNLCNIIGSKMVPLIWKVRKSAAWYDK